MRTLAPPAAKLPNHLELPEADGSIVQSFRELPQSVLLTDAILPVLRRLHPQGDFALGQDCGIYWRITPEPLEGCKCPDWFYVPGVPATLDGTYRRSYARLLPERDRSLVALLRQGRKTAAAGP